MTLLEKIRDSIESRASRLATQPPEPVGSAEIDREARRRGSQSWLNRVPSRTRIDDSQLRYWLTTKSPSEVRALVEALDE